MFKLPLLQPQLTGSNGLDGRTGSVSQYSPFLTSSRSVRDRDTAALGAEIKDWESQARDITSDVVSSDKYKSLALHAEVKFAEAMERCVRVCPTAHTPAGEERPNKLKTAVCCQLLGEFADLCGPFSKVLRGIREELVKSIYSWYYVSERGLLIFDQLPWFSVAERLEREKEAMVEEREKFTAMLHEQQEMISRIEEQLAAYQRATNTAQLEAASLKSRLESLQANEESARLEAKTGREELKRLRKEWLKMKDEIDGERAAHAGLKESTDRELTQLRSQMKVMSDALARADSAVAEAQEAANMRLPPEAVSNMRAQLDETQEGLKNIKAKLKEAEGENRDLRAKLGSMTPRPQWRQVHKHGVEEEAGRRTQDTVAAVAERLGAYAAAQGALAAQVAALQALLLAPDPPPREVQLAITADSSQYFITEGDDAGGSSGPLSKGPARVSARGLGTGPEVPRCLRWRAGTPVELRVLSLEETEALVQDVWAAKAAHDASCAPQHLQSYLYTYFSGRVPEAAAAAAAAAAGAGEAPGAAVSSSAAAITEAALAAAAANPGAPAGAVHAAVAVRAYELYHACSVHAPDSPAVRLFRHVLSGTLPESAHWDQQVLLLGLLRAGEALAQGGSSSGSSAAGDVDASVSTSAMQEALQQLLPHLPPYKLMKLKDAYASSVHPEAASLQHLRALLLPLARLHDPAAVAAAASAAGTPAAGTAAPAAAASPSSSPEPVPCLNNAFVTSLLDHHLSDLEHQAAEAAAHLAAPQPAVPAAGAAEPLGAPMTLAAAVAALEQALPHDRALQCAVEALAGPGAGGAGHAHDELQFALLTEPGGVAIGGGPSAASAVQLAGAALFGRKLQAQNLLRPVHGFYDLQALAQWVAAKQQQR